MEQRPREKWYFRTWTLLVSFLLVGPFMLPLVWANPHFSKKEKVVVTVVAIILTLLISASFVYVLKKLNAYYLIILERAGT